MNTPLVHKALTTVYGEDGDLDTLIRVRDSQCPTGKMGDAWDTAYAALYLASDEAKYVTGTELVVDGGLSVRFV
jgi:NAD(P)-dependent dehydrogenase (short-subunit alcohol dehydrogenase family)